MSPLLDQLGPGEFLKPWLEAVIREKVKVKEIIFKKEEDQFIPRLQSMQTALAGLAKLHQNSDLSTAAEQELKHYNNLILELDKDLSDLFGGRDELQKALNVISSMNFYKRVMMELESESFVTILIIIHKIIHLYHLLKKNLTHRPKFIVSLGCSL